MASLAVSKADRMEQRQGGAMSIQCNDILSKQDRTDLQTSLLVLGPKEPPHDAGTRQQE